MNLELSNFADRLRELIANPQSAIRNPRFSTLALELFRLQFKDNGPYRKICEARHLTPGIVEHWTQIPAVPTAAFKELELTCLMPDERTSVFHSSGTTEQKPSRHFHNAESLAVYETSLWEWFKLHLLRSADGWSASPEKRGHAVRAPVVILTPPPKQAPHSSLVHMFEMVRQKLDVSESAFVGKITDDGAWTLDFDAVLFALNSSLATGHPSLLLGTAFSFVQLLDYLAENNLCFQLPPGSRVMETGGYKNRSRSMPKGELHQLFTARFGVPLENVICEYGMSELSSQAYNSAIHHRVFRFPPWARAQIISPETGHEVADGGTGLIRIVDLANVFSVVALQTEDLGIRRGEHFELLGRAALAEARGCSLMTV